MILRIAVAVVLWLGLVTPALAASDFYPLAQRWAKSRAEAAGKDQAVEGAFKAALPAAGESSDPYAQPIPSLRRTLSSIAASGETIELESGQLLQLSSDAPIVKFASTEEAVAELAADEASTLIVTGREIGKAVLHVWEASGRKTFEVRVVPRKITGPTYFDLRRDELQKTRPFKVRLTADTGTFERGVKFRELDRTSLDASQSVVVEGDSPYGFLHSHAQVQRSGLSTKNTLTDAQVALIDGKVGPVDNFNAAVGDSQVKPSFLVFSRGRIRGVSAEKWTEDKRFNLSGFFGREQLGIFAPLSPSISSSKRTIDSFLSGTVADYRPSDDFRMRTGYFTGYGKTRPDELNKQGLAISAEANAGEAVTFLPEVDFDTEHVAQQHAVRFKGEKAELRTEFRNINEDFQSMIGAPAQQGEVGGRFYATAQPWERWRWNGTLDVFKDRLIPNEENIGRYNVHADSEITYEIADRSALAFTWRDWDDTGRLSPTRERTFGLQYTESFEAFDRTIAVNVRGGHRRSRFLTQSLSDYDRNELTTGVFFPLFWDIRFSLQKEWNWLDDLNRPDRRSQPEAIIYSLSYSHRLWETPFYVDLDVRHRDEEETESPNSFMTGEDSTELSGGLYYRESEDLELYLKGQLQNFKPESLDVTEDRVEAQVLAGMRWDWDTGIRWSGVGSVGGYVFKDENGNGVRDEGEPGLPGIGIETLSGAKTVSDADGRFDIRNIADRQTAVSVDTAKLPTGYVPTGSLMREVPIESGRQIAMDFGFAPRSEVTGSVFNDVNGNGRFDAGEPGVGRVRLRLGGKSALSSPSGGAYAFRGVDPGSYQVELDLSSVAEGYLPTDVTKKSLELAEGMRFEWNVPLRAYRVVSGRLFRDRDANGGYSSPEDQPVSGAVVTLGTLRQTSDSQGRFLFDNVPSGTYPLAVDASVLMSGEKIDAPPPIVLGLEPKTVTEADIALTPTVRKPVFGPTTGPQSAGTAKDEVGSGSEAEPSEAAEGVTEPSV